MQWFYNFDKQCYLTYKSLKNCIVSRKFPLQKIWWVLVRTLRIFWRKNFQKVPKNTENLISYSLAIAGFIIEFNDINILLINYGKNAKISNNVWSLVTLRVIEPAIVRPCPKRGRIQVLQQARNSSGSSRKLFQHL